MTNRPKEPPEEAAPKIIAVFFAEYLPGVEKEFELLVRAGEGPLTISLFDFQMETLIFGLHCLDRAVFAQFGDEYRAAFMDQAFGFACDAFAAALPDELVGNFIGRFDKHRQTRQKEYGAMKPFPSEDGALKGVLSWEYAKRICTAAGAEEPLVLKVLLEEANAILLMMMKVAQTI